MLGRADSARGCSAESQWCPEDPGGDYWTVCRIAFLSGDRIMAAPLEGRDCSTERKALDVAAGGGDPSRAGTLRRWGRPVWRSRRAQRPARAPGIAGVRHGVREYRPPAWGSAASLCRVRDQVMEVVVGISLDREAGAGKAVRRDAARDQVGRATRGRDDALSRAGVGPAGPRDGCRVHARDAPIGTLASAAAPGAPARRHRRSRRRLHALVRRLRFS